jgi:hypothetical protein
MPQINLPPVFYDNSPKPTCQLDVEVGVEKKILRLRKQSPNDTRNHTGRA